MHAILLSSKEYPLINKSELVRNDIFPRLSLKSINKDIIELETLIFTSEFVDENITEIKMIKALKTFILFNNNLKILYLNKNKLEEELKYENLLKFLNEWDCMVLEDYNVHDIQEVQEYAMIDDNKPMRTEITLSSTSRLIDQNITVDMEYVNRLAQSLELFSDYKVFLQLINNYPDKARDLLFEYRRLKQRADEKDLKMHNLIMQNDILKEELQNIQVENMLMASNNSDINTNYNIIKTEYQKALSVIKHNQEILNNVKNSRLQFYDTFTTTPMTQKIIYFKEYVYPQYFNTFITYLHNYLKSIHVPSKLLIIESPSAKSKISFYQGCNIIYDNNYSIKDIIDKDITVIFNNPAHVLENFYEENVIGYEILLVYDKTQAPFNYTKGDKMLLFNLTRTLDQCNMFQLDELNTITNDEDNPLGLSTIEDFKEIKEIPFLAEATIWNTVLFNNIKEVIETLRKTT